MKKIITENGYPLNVNAKYILICIEDTENIKFILDAVLELSKIDASLDIVCAISSCDEFQSVYKEKLRERLNVYLMYFVNKDILSFLIKDAYIVCSNSADIEVEALNNARQFIELGSSDNKTIEMLNTALGLVETEIISQLEEQKITE